VDSPPKEICRRIAQLRLETAGPRGKSSFANKLGLSPSTYDYYERSRVPPADVLLQIADLTGADLRWLLTGQAGEKGVVAAGHPVLQRAAALLADRPDAAEPLAAFLDILAAAMRFPAKPAEAAQPPEPDPAAADGPTSAAAGEPAGGIAVLGRSAAGVPQFWAHPDEAAGLTSLEALISRHAAGAPRRVRPATADDARGGDPTRVQLVTLRAPDADEAVEFVLAPDTHARWPDAFALRIDGDSMAPDIRHGDLVLLSPGAQAADGQPAVVQLQGQIGVTCKLFRRRGDVVHLVPINERYEIAAFPAEQVVWALRVLGRVRV